MRAFAGPGAPAELRHFAMHCGSDLNVQGTPASDVNDVVPNAIPSLGSVSNQGRLPEMVVKYVLLRAWNRSLKFRNLTPQRELLLKALGDIAKNGGGANRLPTFVA